MAALDGALREEAGDPEQPLRALVTWLLPLAGVDVEAAAGHAGTYVANFPLAGRALGDLDERAAAWLAQLMDEPPARDRLRELLAGLAAAWADPWPLAAERAAGWAAEAAPADPRQDEPWMAAMLALAAAAAAA